MDFRNRMKSFAALLIMLLGAGQSFAQPATTVTKDVLKVGTSTIEQVLAAADKGTGTTVLEDLYRSWRATPVKVDLAGLWSQLGVSDSPEGVLFDESAPLSNVRDTILDL